MNDLKEALNRQTAKIDWNSLQPFFAQGLLINVDKGLDLVEMATHFAENSHQLIQNYLDTAQIRKVDDAEALLYVKHNPTFWAVVVDPWVLVQVVD